MPVKNKKFTKISNANLPNILSALKAGKRAHTRVKGYQYYVTILENGEVAYIPKTELLPPVHSGMNIKDVHGDVPEQTLCNAVYIKEKLKKTGTQSPLREKFPGDNK
jgi:hypothetical protein